MVSAPGRRPAVCTCANELHGPTPDRSALSQPRCEKLRNTGLRFAPRHDFASAAAYDHLQLTGTNAWRLQGPCSLELQMTGTVQSDATPPDLPAARKRL